MTEEEYEQVMVKAKENQMSLSKYVRKSILQDKIVVVPGMIELTKQIAKIGNNLNQLTMLAHQGNIKEIDLFSTKDAIMSVVKELRGISNNNISR